MDCSSLSIGRIRSIEFIGSIDRLALLYSDINLNLPIIRVSSLIIVLEIPSDLAGSAYAEILGRTGNLTLSSCTINRTKTLLNHVFLIF